MTAVWLLAAVLAADVDPGIQALSDRMHAAASVEGRLMTPPTEFLGFTERILAEFPDRDWSVHIRDELITDAEAMPDGRLYLSLGLFGDLGSEADLAFVIAHEAAHVTLGHAIEADPGEGHRDDQDAADREALAVLARLGYPRGTARRVLEVLTDRLPPRAARAAGMPRRLAALPAPESDRSGPVPGLATLRADLVQRWLDRNRLGPAQDCLNGPCGAVLEPNLRRLLQARAARLAGRPAEARVRLSGMPESVEVLRERALAADWSTDCESALLLWNGAVGARDGPIAPWASNDACVVAADRESSGPDRRPTPSGWSRVGGTGHDLTLTRDDPTLQRLDLDWHQGEPVAPALAFDAALRDWRARHPRRLARVLEVRPEAGGVCMDLGFTDRNGLEWRVRIHRLPAVGGGTLEAVFTAPALYLFQRDGAVAEDWILAGAATRFGRNAGATGQFSTH